jgi:hypothetical protein
MLPSYIHRGSYNCIGFIVKLVVLNHMLRSASRDLVCMFNDHQIKIVSTNGLSRVNNRNSSRILNSMHLIKSICTHTKHVSILDISNLLLVNMFPIDS